MNVYLTIVTISSYILIFCPCLAIPTRYFRQYKYYNICRFSYSNLQQTPSVRCKTEKLYLYMRSISRSQLLYFATPRLRVLTLLQVDMTYSGLFEFLMEVTQSLESRWLRKLLVLESPVIDLGDYPCETQRRGIHSRHRHATYGQPSIYGNLATMLAITREPSHFHPPQLFSQSVISLNDISPSVMDR